MLLRRDQHNTNFFEGPSRGSNLVRFKLPGNVYAAVTGKDQKERRQEPMEQNNKTVLVVDDDCDIRYLLSVRLISAGYMVCEAANGWEALEQMGEPLS